MYQHINIFKYMTHHHSKKDPKYYVTLISTEIDELFLPTAILNQFFKCVP